MATAPGKLTSLEVIQNFLHTSLLPQLNGKILRDKTVKKIRTMQDCSNATEL